MVEPVTKPRVRIAAGSRETGGKIPRPAAYLRDTRSGVIESRPVYLREHRDEVRRVWDRTAALAMDIIQNSGKLKGACDQIIADTVGSELTLNPQPDLSGLGYSDDERREFIAIIKRRWKMWAWNPSECDFRGKLTIPQMADVGIRWFIAFGESTGVVSYMSEAHRRRYGIGSGTKMLMTSPTKLVRETREIEGLYQGIFHDENGRAKAYRFRHRTNGISNDRDFSARDADGRQLVMHAFDPMDADDVRGISLLAPTFKQHLQHDRLRDAALQTFILQTIFAVTLTSDNASKDAFEALQAIEDDDLSGAFVEYFQGALDRAAASKINVSDEPTVSHLAPGEKLSFENVNAPGSQFLPISNALDRDMARALGITFGGLTMNHENSTYSSVRMETSSIWPVVLRRRERIAAPHYQVPYESWLDEEIGSGRIPFKGGYEAFKANRDRVCWALWQGPAKPTADDGKAAKASSERIANGTGSLARENADLGNDGDEIFDERLREHRRYIDAGMRSPYDRGFGGGSGKTGDAEEDDEDRPARVKEDA